jgi:hypothetical protein
MQDYKPNSHRFKETQKDTTPSVAPEKPKIEKVISGKATAKPKSGIAKFFEVFLAEDFSKVTDYVLKDIVVPTIKDTIWTVIARGSERMLYGEAGHAPKNGSKLPFVNYGGMFKNASQTSTAGSANTNNQFSVDNIILEDRGDAERVLEAMKAYIAEYGAVSISELYEFIGEPIGEYTTTRWGWRSLNTAGIMRTTNGGYKLDLPKAIPLK